MSFWRKDDPVLEPVLTDGKETGRFRVIKGGLWPHQRSWWDMPNFVKLLVGGFGVGKSELLCKWSIAAALHNAPVWSAIVSPSFPQARNTIIPTIERLLKGKSTLRRDLKWAHNKTEHRFYLDIDRRPRATLLYLSGDNPDSLKGPNLGTVAIDEPFIQERKVFEMMVARCRDPGARMLGMGLAGTPEELNWGYELAEGDLRQNYDVGYLCADTKENRALPAEYRERLVKGYDPKAVEAYVGGKFVSLTTGLVFYGFDKDRNVKTVKAPDDAIHFWGTDFNVDPMAYVVGWHAGERCHIYAEEELPNTNTEYAASQVRELFPKVRQCFPDPTGKRRATSAPVGASDHNDIRKAGFTVLAPNGVWPRRDSENSVNKMLGHGRLTIEPTCKKLIHYLRQYAHETAHKQESMSHLLDAMRYPLTYLFPSHRPATIVTRMVGA